MRLPTAEVFPPQFSGNVFSRHLQQVYLYGPIYLALSGVTRPFGRYLRPFKPFYHQ